DLARMHVFLGPAHFGGMDQAFDARLQLDECAIVGNVGDAAPEFGTRGVLVLDAFPRIGLELFHAERDAMRLRIETHHLHLDALADMQGLRRMVDAPPRDVGDMQQTVDAAKIDERAVIGDVLHDAGQDLAFLEAGDQLGAGLGAAFLEHRASRHHDIAAAAIHLEDLERLRRAEQGGDIAHRADIDLAAGQERDGAVEIDGEATFDAAENGAVDALVRLKALFEQGPGFLPPRLVAADLRLAVLVFHPFEEDFDDVARLDFGATSRPLEFLEGHPAFGLQPYIDENRVVLDRYHGAFDHRAFEPGAGAERFIQQCGKTLLRFFRGLRDGHALSTLLPKSGGEPRGRREPTVRRRIGRGGDARRR